MGDVRASLDRYVERISAPVAAPVAGGQRVAGGDEAGSGGDD
jgi:hypothetical protein